VCHVARKEEIQIIRAAKEHVSILKQLLIKKETGNHETKKSYVKALCRRQ